MRDGGSARNLAGVLYSRMTLTLCIPDTVGTS